MADYQAEHFDKRLRRILKRHRKMSQGYITSVNHDGLIIARPRRQGFRFPWKALMFAAMLLFAVKGMLYSALGGLGYADRVQRLSEGSYGEQVGAFVMQADPATIWVADRISELY